MDTIARALKVRNRETFFLWGPRQTGKSFFLRERFPNAIWIDLLKNDEFVKYTAAPHRLREELLEQPRQSTVIVDEIQKVPALLDEIHWLIENRQNYFGLCGSSARKVKRGHANLLGGRAVRYEMFGFTAHELGADFQIERILNHGYFPRSYLSAEPNRFLKAYVNDYLKEEVANEGLVRNLPAFSDFLRATGITDTEVVNFTNIASECGVSSSTARDYYDILVDTLLGNFLPAYTRKAKRRILHAPKFYLKDVGVVNALARRGKLSAGSELFGKAFENWVYHELRAYVSYQEKDIDLSYWRLSSGHEVDFIVNDVEIAIEAKSSKKIQSKHLKGLRELKNDHPSVKSCYVVSLETRSRKTEDGIVVLSIQDFISRLWSGKLIG